jgi:hypothetical protein
VQGLAPLLGFLRDAGAAPPQAETGPDGEAGILTAEFAGYLAGERGLRPQTVARYARSARRLMAATRRRYPTGDHDQKRRSGA